MRTLATHAKRGGAGLILGLLSVGCVLGPSDGASHGEYPGHVTLEIATTAAAGRATLVADLERMTVVMTSGRDTVADTITAQGSRTSVEPAWLNGTGGRAHLFVRYPLQAGRRWTVLVRTYDARDSLVHEERREVEGLRSFEYRDVRVDMAPRRMVYAVQATLPALDGAGRPVRYARAELVVDGAVVRDTVLATAVSATPPTTAFALAYPDMRPGLRAVELRVYGTTGDGRASDLLLSGGTTLNAGLARTAAEEPVPLVWADGGAPLPGAAAAEENLAFRLGAVGAVTMNVVMSGAVML